MRVGLYFDQRNPPPWRKPWAEVYRSSLELAEKAEQWGIDSLWTTEHHFFEDGYLPQPLTFAAALAARTRTARIGTAVLLAPLRPAVQIAEEAAVVDLISGGRLDLGLGAGYRTAEFGAYGAGAESRFSTLERRVAEIRELLAGGVVTPPPVQDPLPLWLGYLGLAGARRAGRAGVGLLSLVPGAARAYIEGLGDGGHDVGSGRLAGLVYAVVTDDPERTWEIVAPHLAYQLHSYQFYAADGGGSELPPPPPAAEVRSAAVRSDSPGIFPALAVVTPDEAVDILRRVDTGGLPAEAFFWASIAGMPDDVTARHVELLCTKVRPAVSEL